MIENNMRRPASGNNMKVRRRRRRRRKAPDRKFIIMAVAVLGALILLVGGIIALPHIRVGIYLAGARSAIEDGNFDKAVEKSEKAVKVNKNEPDAYRYLSKGYAGKGDIEAAEKALLEGFELTQDEALTSDYCAYNLNEAVAEINEGNASFDSIEHCIDAMRKDASMEEIYTVLNAACDAVLSGNGERFDFERYLEAMQSLIDLYNIDYNEKIKTAIDELSVVRCSEYHVTTDKLKEYGELLSTIKGITSNATLDSLSECINTALEAEAVFEPAFEIFESEDMKPIKKFIQTKEYIDYRDSFLNETNTLWEGSTYIPVCREYVKFMYTDGGYKFAFPGFDENEDTRGIINIWAAKQEDDGVQRLAISYEPPKTSEGYFPHTTYEIIYLYSNVKVVDKFVPLMNYRLETRVLTEEGETTTVIGDWGGTHEWVEDF